MSENRLGSEKSPYLLQHKNNPVHWLPWGDEAFERARGEDKPIFLSIGYSTCYWCHVMEGDSFESQEVADVLNEHFICIKVDREERPDIDKIYMDFVMAMTGHGGWPLSAFLTPELKPFFGGTFFPREQFIPLLRRLHEVWTQDRERVLESAAGITNALQESDIIGAAEHLPGEDAFRAAFNYLAKLYDPTFGGFGAAPKFPPVYSIMLLFRIHRRTGDMNALEMALSTLRHMSRGGIYDQLGGGFSRYSTDARWLVPHFEKMLYDNALLASAYLEAYQITKSAEFADTARETLDYLLQDMRDPTGAFHSAEDAGEVGREGEYYVWSYEELEQLLSEDELQAVAAVYGATPEGNFEGNNVLHLTAEWSEKTSPSVRQAMDKLREARKKRTRPHKDDKVLTSWNALAITALSKGYQVLNDERYLRAATECFRFIESTLRSPSGGLYHRYRDGEARIEGFLEDYAYLIQACLDLYESDFDRNYIIIAQELQQLLDSNFWDEEHGGYFFSPAEDSSVLIRKKDQFDGPTPSGSGISAINLLRLYHLTYTDEYLKRAENILRAAKPAIERFPMGLASTLIALDFRLDRTKEIAVIGPDESVAAREYVEPFYLAFLPNRVLAYRSSAELDDAPISLLNGKEAVDEEAMFYICEERTCLAPTEDREQAVATAESFREYTLRN